MGLVDYKHSSQLTTGNLGFLLHTLQLPWEDYRFGKNLGVDLVFYCSSKKKIHPNLNKDRSMEETPINYDIPAHLFYNQYMHLVWENHLNRLFFRVHNLDPLVIYTIIFL
jgi:hypothetical protein